MRIKGTHTHTLRESVAKRVFQFASKLSKGECGVGNQARRHLMGHDTHSHRGCSAQ